MITTGGTCSEATSRKRLPQVEAWGSRFNNYICVDKGNQQNKNIHDMSNRDFILDGITFHTRNEYEAGYKAYTIHIARSLDDAEELALKALAKLIELVGGESWSAEVETKDGETVEATWHMDGMSDFGDEFAKVRIGGESKKVYADSFYEAYRIADIRSIIGAMSEAPDTSKTFVKNYILDFMEANPEGFTEEDKKTAQAFYEQACEE